MPPKPKSAKPKTPKDDKVSEGNEGTSKEQLEGQILRLRDEIDREREERSFFQLERDKISTFWEITKRQLEEAKAELRNKDREAEEAEERHAVEIKVYKQKVKHLLYEHQNQTTELKADGAMSMKVAQDDHLKQEANLRKDKRALKVELKEIELSHEDIVKNLQLEHDKLVSKLREDYERTARELHQKYEKRMGSLREDLELQRKVEIHEIEERKNGQINALMRNHEKAFTDIKNYYNDITLNNLALINSLKEQVEEMKKKEERTEKQMAEIVNENKKLTEPLTKARAEVAELQRQLMSYDKDKITLSSCKARLKVQDETISSLSWELEVLRQRFSSLETERDDLYDKFVKSIHDVQQKTGFKNILLEKKLSTLSSQLEKKEAQLNEVLAASNLDPTALSVVTRKLEDVLDAKNTAIKDLQYELARVCKSHNDLVQTYETKLKEFGIPVDELGFQPMQAMQTTSSLPSQQQQQLGKGPAGLVSAT